MQGSNKLCKSPRVLVEDEITKSLFEKKKNYNAPKWDRNGIGTQL